MPWLYRIVPRIGSHTGPIIPQSTSATTPFYTCLCYLSSALFSISLCLQFLSAHGKRTEEKRRGARGAVYSRLSKVKATEPFAHTNQSTLASEKGVQSISVKSPSIGLGRSRPSIANILHVLVVGDDDHSGHREKTARRCTGANTDTDSCSFSLLICRSFISAREYNGVTITGSM